MDFSKKFLRILSLVLTVLILLPAVPSFAATFKDVKSSHWAYSYIEDMASKGYIVGDPGGTFRPDLPSGSLSYLEVLTFVSRLLNVTSAEKQAMKTTYQTTVTKNGVPTWAQEAVMMCLYKGVINEAELEYAASMDMIKVGTTKRVGRLSTSIYLAKAMGLEDEANAKSFVSLTYKDLLKIDAKYHKLIYVLIEAGVLSANGTGDGYFEPSGFVSRAQMAKMLSTAVEYLAKNPQTPTTPTTPTTPVVDKEVITGEITMITKLGTNTFVSVKGKTEAAYLVDSKTVIKIDGKTSSINDLYQGQMVDVTIQKGTSNALSIEAENVEQEITGTIKSLSASTNKFEVEYLDNKTKKTVMLTVDKNSDITLNGVEVGLKDLAVGDEVKLLMENYLVIEMEATSKFGEVEGIIVELTTEGDRDPIYYVTIENSKKVKTEYEFHEDASIYKDGRRAEFKDLKLGDEAIIELEYGLVVEIDAEMVEKEIQGFIVAIATRLNTGTEITIKNRETGKEETYTLARNAVIKVDNVATSIFNVNVGYFVEVVVGGNEIIELYADPVGAESIVRGKVVSISTKRNEIVLSVMTTDLTDYEFGDELTILVDTKTVISEGVYNKLTLADISRNDTLYIFGFYDGIEFRATEINIR